MSISREALKAEADSWRKRAEPIWEALEGRDRDRDRRAFEASLVHLEQQRLCITVMGEFNAGKSTLLNTFLDERLLAMDQLECTAVPTWVRWADDEEFDESRQAVVVYGNGESDAMPWSEISAHTTLDQEAWKEIERVEVMLPQPVYEPRPTGLVLVDTPGLNGDWELESRSIHQLGMSHVTIVVVPADGIGRNTDIALIERALSIADRVMVVINRCDQQNFGNGFERFREELRRRVPGLRSEQIYTLSAKRQLDGADYRDGEDELHDEFVRFRDSLKSSVLKDPDSALRSRPRKLLREICSAEIAAFDKDEVERDAGAVRELAAAHKRLEETKTDLERSQETVVRLARSTMQEETRYLQEHLPTDQSRVEREMRRFVDGFDDAALLNLDAVRDRISSRLRESMQPLFDRASRLLRAVARRLFFDLEERVRDVDELDLPRVASLRLDTAMWKQEADRANGSLRRRSSAVETCRREVEECEQEVVQLQEDERILGVQCDELRELETRRAAAVAARGKLGPKPTPEVESYIAHETREVKRGGLFGWLVDLFGDPMVERVPVTRQRWDYSRVEQWEAEFNAWQQEISRLDEWMQPMAEEDRTTHESESARKRFADMRNQVVALLEQSVAVAEDVVPLLGEDGATSLPDTFRERARQVREKEFVIVVVGELNRGKSALLNAMMGRDVLTMDALECTATVNFLRQPKPGAPQSSDEVVVHFNDERAPETVSVGELREYTSDLSNLGRGKVADLVNHVDVFVGITLPRRQRRAGRHPGHQHHHPQASADHRGPDRPQPCRAFRCQSADAIDTVG